MFTLFKHVPRGFFLPAGCLSAWWWPSWRGWHTDLCPRRAQPDRPRWLLVVPSRQSSGNVTRSWNPEQSREPDAGMVVCEWAARCSSDNDESRGGQRSLVCSDGASSLHQWQVHSCGQLWSPAAFGEPFLRSICEQSAWYEPCFHNRWTACWNDWNQLVVKRPRIRKLFILTIEDSPALPFLVISLWLVPGRLLFPSPGWVRDVAAVNRSQKCHWLTSVRGGALYSSSCKNIYSIPDPDSCRDATSSTSYPQHTAMFLEQSGMQPN